MSYKFTQTLSRLIVYIVLIFIALLCVLPIYLLFINATRTSAQIQSGISLLPSGNFMQNWRNFNNVGSMKIEQAFLNSAIIAVSSTFIAVYFAFVTAYAIEVYNFKIKRILYSTVLVLVMIPGTVSIVGFYQLMSSFNWLNTFLPMIVPAIAGASGVFFAKQYLESCVIKELIHAGRIDGCSELGILHKIMFPIAIPGMFTLAIMSFVAAWNNFFLPFMIITQDSKKTLPMMINTIVYGNTYNRDYGILYLGIAISIIPVVVVYAFLSSYIVGGMSMGAVKE